MSIVTRVRGWSSSVVSEDVPLAEGPLEGACIPGARDLLALCTPWSPPPDSTASVLRLREHSPRVSLLTGQPQ